MDRGTASKILTAPAERRQLTIMFCDMVGSSALSTRLDPEEQSEIIAGFHACCAKEVKSLGGMVAQYLGDGVLAYFGYPAAHENDAERAILAALGILKSVGTIRTAADVGVQTRIAIGSGVVVVGDLVGQSVTQENAAIGETTNLVARLQAIAEPNTIVISPVTRRLVGALFDYRDLGRHTLKGFSEPVHVCQVLGVSKVESRFEAQHQAGTSLLLGRERELELLQRRWGQAKGGEGQVVLLTGEPGIGKSRLARALQDRLTSDRHTPLNYFCAPHYQGSALYPVIGQLTRAAGIEREDSAESKLDKLESLLTQSSGNLDEDVPLFAALLSIPGGDRHPLPEMTPQRRKERTLAALLDQVKRLATHQPILIVYEDLHWIDPTSLELLSLAIEQIKDQRILLVATARPEFTPPWPGDRHVSPLSLNRFGRSECEALIGGITKGKSLPAEVTEQIIARTDGVPLFVEELTKTVLESGLLRDLGDHYELTGPLPPLAIPSTLHASLLARLDRLAAVKDVAQIGAVIGREFSYPLIAAVAILSERDLNAALAQLVAAELIFQRGVPPDATYQFKHALVQDASYASLVRSRRQQLHGQIAKALEEQFPDVVASEPEVLAHHFAAAGLTERGVFYLQRAGQQASDRSANLEAVTHFNAGLELLKQLPDTPARAHQELALHMGLGAALLVTKGYASAEAERSYLRARELCLRVGETPDLAPIVFGLWRSYLVRSRLQAARELGETLLRLAEQAPSLSAAAHYALGLTALFSGVSADSCRHFEVGIQRYAPNLRRAPVFQIGLDPGVGCRICAGWALWVRGYPDQSAARLHDGMIMARELSHPFTMAFAHGWAAMCFQMRRDVTAALEHAGACLALSTEHGFPYWAALGTILRGWALMVRERSEEGIAQLSQGIAAWRGAGAALSSYPLMLLAEASSHLGHINEGLRSLDEAQALWEHQEDRWLEAEIYRLRGELLLRQSNIPEAEVEVWLHRALDVARRQQAKSLELHAATSLARLWHAQGKHSKARDLLSPVHGWFTEGFKTVDLKAANALLADMSV
jgi:class 3 adenylate cyclase/predicted ATPase